MTFDRKGHTLCTRLLVATAPRAGQVFAELCARKPLGTLRELGDLFAV